MNSDEFWTEMYNVLDAYLDLARENLFQRWERWEIDLARAHEHEVIGALMARQVTLVSHLCEAPTICNGHIAPIILRVMVDTLITFKWILKDLSARANKFILYGLGQEKLYIEHLKKKCEADGKNPAEDAYIEVLEKALAMQRIPDLTEVNLGSWSGQGTRDMAIDAGCELLYNTAYSPFSAATHSMWNHVSRYNLMTCENPLHGYHRNPVLLVLPYEPDYVFRGAKYLEKTFVDFDERFQVKIDCPSPLESLNSGFKHIATLQKESQSEAAERD